MDIWFWVVVLPAAALIALLIVRAMRTRSRVDPTDVSLDPALVANVRELYRKGDKMAAVKALRAATGLGLADAIRIADKLGATAKPARAKDGAVAAEAPPITASPITASSITASSIAAAIGPDHDDELRSLVAAGRQIEAIKLVRTLTGMGLKDAKLYVERLPPR